MLLRATGAPAKAISYATARPSVRKTRCATFGCRLRQNPVGDVRASASAAYDVALINVDYISPSLWLGVVLAVSGMTLYSLKFREARGTTEGDIVTASLFVMCGGILTVQGWRLDPILMLSEFVLGGVGIFYMIQTVNLRKQLEDQQEQEQELERSANWSWPRQRSAANYDPYDEYDQLPGRGYMPYQDRFQDSGRRIVRESLQDKFEQDELQSWPRAQDALTAREAAQYDREQGRERPSPRERRSQGDSAATYGVETNLPYGTVDPDSWKEKRSKE